MVSAVQDNYLDLSALNNIKLKAKTDSKEALRSVAGEFETIFLKMMLKSMRKASFGNPLFDSDSAKFYRDMRDDQLAMDLSKSGGVGLADTLVKQLARYLPEEQVRKPEATVQSNSRQIPSVSSSKNNTTEITTPKEFVHKLMPHAEVAAKEIGVTPKVLLAQAALETGWGKYVIQQANGESSYNLFNIKADHRWDGKNASISTVEYFGNKAQSREASFRVYDSYEASFKDYVQFLKASPRYSKALENAHNPEAFTNSLQAAGYATDPMYAKKIQRILGDKPMNDALGSLKTDKYDGTRQPSF